MGLERDATTGASVMQLDSKLVGFCFFSCWPDDRETCGEEKHAFALRGANTAEMMYCPCTQCTALNFCTSMTKSIFFSKSPLIRRRDSHPRPLHDSSIRPYLLVYYAVSSSSRSLLCRFLSKAASLPASQSVKAVISDCVSMLCCAVSTSRVHHPPPSPLRAI